MKRTPLKRKTPLKAKAGMKRGGPLRKRRKPKNRETVDKAVLAHGEADRKRDAKYLKWIRTLPCAAMGREIPCHGAIEAAHYRIGSKSGTGIKPCDRRVTPLCNAHHALQHRGERTFWAGHHPEALIRGLNACYPDKISAEAMIRSHL